jgi:hypothetical protein
MSYGLTIKVLEEGLSRDGLNTTSVRHHLQAVGQRGEDELGDEQAMFLFYPGRRNTVHHVGMEGERGELAGEAGG